MNATLSNVRLRILLVDDNPGFLKSAENFLAMEPQIEIVGNALSGEGALEQVARLAPDLVLMDLVMPGMGGLEATRRIKAQAGAPRVVILTFYDNPEYRAAAEAAGADGFIGKSEFGAELMPLIHTLFDPPNAPVLLECLILPGEEMEPVPPAGNPEHPPAADHPEGMQRHRQTDTADCRFGEQEKGKSEIENRQSQIENLKSTGGGGLEARWGW